jgi:hypothetical protein
MIDRVELVEVVTVVYCVETDTKAGREGHQHQHRDREVGGSASLSALRTKQGKMLWREYLGETIDKREAIKEIYQ